MSGMDSEDGTVVLSEYQQWAIILQDNLFKATDSGHNISVAKRGADEEIGLEVLHESKIKRDDNIVETDVKTGLTKRLNKGV